MSLSSVMCNYGEGICLQDAGAVRQGVAGGAVAWPQAGPQN